jgi:glutamyl-tRNA synthetase
MAPHMVRTRFAPSPTGYLHIGGARTALFSWAFARHHGGQFILRIEDTDIARSTPEAVQAILDGMAWLELNHDEGPFYQTKRLYRYKEVIEQMLANGQAYHCYCSTEELDAMREAQRARGEKPRYDGTWRPEPGKTLPTPPSGVTAGGAFQEPDRWRVMWKDLVKGASRSPTPNSTTSSSPAPTARRPTISAWWSTTGTCRSPTSSAVTTTSTTRRARSTSSSRAGREVPLYAHLSMILGDDGTKLSKRHGAVSVMQYDDDGYLPEAVINYLARLGWSHGDAELFSVSSSSSGSTSTTSRRRPRSSTPKSSAG